MGIEAIGVTAMRTAQGQLQNAASNIARADDPDARRHESSINTLVTNGSVSGVTLSPAKSMFSEQANIDIRKNSGLYHKHIVEAEYLQKLQTKFGTPNDENSLSDMLAGMKNALHRINTTPSDPGHRTDLMFVAQNFSADVRAIAKEVQDLRKNADQEIAIHMNTINEQLEIIAKSNRDIGESIGKSIAAFQDDRDKALKTLSQYCDFIIVPGQQERINVKLSDGTILVPEMGDPAKMSYVPKSSMTPSDVYPTGFSNIDVTFGGNVTNVTNGIGTGKIAGLVKMRDDVLPKKQQELDEFVKVFRNEFNAAHNKGTGWPAPTSLTGSRTFADPAVDTITYTGTLRVARIDNNAQNGNFADLVDFGAVGPITINAFRDMINAAAIGVTASVTGTGALKLESTVAGHGVALASISDPEAVVTGTGQGVSDYFGLNDFFTTGTNFNGDGVTVGLAQNLGVRSDISANPALIASYHLEKGVAVVGDMAIGAATAGNADAMKNAMDARVSFTAAGNQPQVDLGFAEYTSSILSDLASSINRAQTLMKRDETTQKTLTTLEKSVSGIDRQSEMVNIMKAQQAFQLGAMIAKTANEMQQILLSIKR